MSAGPLAAQLPRTAENKYADRLPSQINHILGGTTPFLEKYLADRPDRPLRKILDAADAHRVQIIFTQINRDRRNRPILLHHTWRLDTLEYFFPASLVKLPTAALALEKLNRLRYLEGYTDLDIDSEMRVAADPRHPCQVGTESHEFSQKHGFNTLLHNIKDVFLVSGNVASDRLYEFVGQEYLNFQLRIRGYSSATIVKRYGHPCSFAENRHTNPMAFYRNGKLVYEQPPQYNPIRIFQPPGIQRTQIPYGVDLKDDNFISLKDLHEMMLALYLPSTVPREKRFRLRLEDYKLLHRYMSMYPTESSDPAYPAFYSTTRMKYLLYGAGAVTHPFPNIRVFNKVGLAWGFLTDCAYIVDFENNVEFFLSATVYVGDHYERDGFPFFEALGKALYNHELERELRRAQNRRYPGRDLSFYRHDYSGY